MLVSCLKAVSLLGSVLMVLNLYRTGLYRHYPIFFAFFIFRIPNSTWPLFLDVSSDLYQKVWILTEAFEFGFYVLMVVELYKLVLEKYKGLYSLGRWARTLAWRFRTQHLRHQPGASDKTVCRSPSKVMFYVLATERGIQTALAILIILILGFLSFFPVKLSRNVRLHALVYLCLLS